MTLLRRRRPHLLGLVVRVASVALAVSVSLLACKSKTGGALPGAGPTKEDAAPPVGPPPAQETPGANCLGDKPSVVTPQTNVAAPPAITVPGGFVLERLADVDSARHITALPNGDLLVGTSGDTIYLVPGAESDGASGAPIPFAKLTDRPAHGVTFARASCTIYAATPQGITSMPYVDGQTKGVVSPPIAKVRVDGSGGHVSTSVAFSQGTLYASVGSSCNACAETDPTRATVQRMLPDGTNMTTRARRIRNAIALSVHPDTGTVWAGGAGQDDLPIGHPYEFLDPVTNHPGVADYGWPDCEENRVAYKPGADCSQVVAPLIVVPAYSTIMGAAFYPAAQGGSFTFPAAYRGGLFLTTHGSWHEANGKYISAPRVVFVEMNGDAPKTPVDWNDPNKQLTDFVSGFETGAKTRIGRPSGITVGPRGSLFIADDHIGAIYRVRPSK